MPGCTNTFRGSRRLTLFRSGGGTRTGKPRGDLRGFPRPAFLCMCLLAVLFFPVRVNADDFSQALRKSPYTEQQRNSLGMLFAEAVEKNIPQELLVPRLEEGIAKKVPYPRLVRALRDELNRLEQARDILLGVEAGRVLAADVASWARTANLLALGVTAREIRYLAGASIGRWGDYRDATVLFVSLIDWGIDREAALALAGAALESPLEGGSFVGIMDLLVTGRRLRLDPERLARIMVRELPSVRDIEDLEERVLAPFE